MFYAADDWPHLVTLLYSDIFAVVLVTCKLTNICYSSKTEPNDKLLNQSGRGGI
jgi:hypothetical protein